MTSGREALHQIDASIAEARRNLAGAGDAAAADIRVLADIDRREVEIFEAIAAVRLDHLNASGAPGGSLGGADSKAAALIEDHRRHIAALAAAREGSARKLEALEASRRDAEARQDAAIIRHDEAAAATRARLDQDADYRRAAGALESLNAMTARAEQKLSAARADRKEKGAAYEADPLFRYLHERGFGTRDYRAFPLFALLDRWVARLISYRDHRLNYQRLLEIPERFCEHVARLTAEQEAAARNIERLEREALERDGVGDLREQAAAARAGLETLDAAIAEEEAAHARAAHGHDEAAAGKQGPLAEARRLLAEALAQISVPDLKILAAETASPEDDRLVDAFVRLKRERLELEEARAAAAGSLRRQSKGLAELEEVRRRFKTARYDSPYSEFSGRAAIGVLLAEFLRGAIGRDDVWRRIERGHRTRPREWDYDLGGDEWRDRFGLPDHWGDVRGGESWSGRPRRPRPPRIPRLPGGFRTGGGFGGGGFKTGGGF